MYSGTRWIVYVKLGLPFSHSQPSRTVESRVSPLVSLLRRASDNMASSAFYCTTRIFLEFRMRRHIVFRGRGSCYFLTLQSFLMPT